MQVFVVKGESTGGTPFSYRLREADVLYKERLTTDEVFKTLEQLYDFTGQTGFPDCKFSIESEKETDPVFDAFQELRPVLNYSSIEEERKIFDILQRLKYS